MADFFNSNILPNYNRDSWGGRRAVAGAVSYTHLDVYKRQMSRRSVNNMVIRKIFFFFYYRFIHSLNFQ